MQKIILSGRAHALPAAWAQCTAAQIRAAAPLALGAPPTAENRLAVLGILSTPAISPRDVRRLNPQERFDLLETVRWCWAEPLDACPMRSFTHLGAEYHLPPADYSYMGAAEFAMAHLHLTAFLRGHAASLDRLTATLCRPLDPYKDPMHPRFDGEVRQHYSSPAADRRAQLFRTLDAGAKIMALQYYLAFQRHFRSRYDIFEAPAQGEAGPAPGSPPAQDSAVIWMKLLFDIGETGVFGCMDQVYTTDIHAIGFYLQKKRDQRRAA